LYFNDKRTIFDINWQIYIILEMNYRRRNNQIQAVQWKTHEDDSLLEDMLGDVPFSIEKGSLEDLPVKLIITVEESIIIKEFYIGDYIVLEEGVLTIYDENRFNEIFEESSLSIDGSQWTITTGEGTTTNAYTYNSLLSHTPTESIRLTE